MDAKTLLNISAILLGFAALFGWLNSRYLKLPLTIGLMLIALLASISVTLLDAGFGLGFGDTARTALAQVDFHDSLMIGMLHLLLFAGALHADLDALLRHKWHILLMATLGVLLSTLFIGFTVYYLAPLLGFSIPFIWCLVFGSLISPTDPVAVLSILRTLTVPKALQAKITGESLFNDGVGVVIFLALLGIATSDAGTVGPAEIGRLLFDEVVVGVLIGLVLGYVAYLAMRQIDDYVVEVIISIALVMGIYALCNYLHASGPLGVVIAGLFIGNHGSRYAMSISTQEHLEKFWELIDEVLNAVLFLLIGFELLVIPYSTDIALIALLAIPIVLIGRTIAVSVPSKLIQASGGTVEKGSVPVLIWGGLRGGISVALALSLPAFEGKPIILAMTYSVVVFSILIQGLTVQKVIARVLR